MRHGSLMLAAGLTVTALSGCSDEPVAPSRTGEVAALKKQASPTITTNMGPFEGLSGCAYEFSVFYGSAAFDVNADGVAVGSTSCVAGEYLTFRWSELQGMQQLANFEGGYPIIFGESISNNGTIAAIYLAWNDIPSTFSRPTLWTATNGRVDLVPAAECDPLADLPWCNDVPGFNRINDNDVVTGTYTGGAYRWTAETGLVYLPILGSRAPTAINSHGDIVAAPSGGGSAALLRRSGFLLEISGIWPNGMNNKREIVGYSGNWPNPSAVIWTRGMGVQPLGTLGGTFSVAYDINDKREVVGASTNVVGEMRAFYWTRSRGMVDLGPGIAYAISDEGHMVGIAPTGLFPPDQEEPLQELWQATMWRGTAGVPSAARAVRGGGAQPARAHDCFMEEGNWQSRPRMLRCLAAPRDR